MKRIDRLHGIDVLRVFAFICIFLSHTGVGIFHYSGGCGVSLFFVLSGALLIKKQYERGTRDISILKSTKHAIGRIWALYPLHILTTLVMFAFLDFEKNRTISNVIKILFNILLIQEWIPLFEARSYNNVSWYLSALLFIYICFPYISAYIHAKKRNTRWCMVSLCKCFVFQFGIGLLSEWLVSKEIVPYYMGTYLRYNCPAVRLIDFIEGCLIGYIIWNYKPNNDFPSKKELDGKYTFFEVILIALMLFIQLSCGIYRASNNISLWWASVLVFSPIACISIFVFSHGKGYLSKIAYHTNCVSRLAFLSRYGFLIHFVVLKYVDSMTRNLVTNRIVFYAIKNVIGFGLTILLSILWDRIWHIVNKYAFKVGNA